MPRLSVWLVRTALLALLAGSAFGAWLLGTGPVGSRWGALRAVHFTLLLFGWLLPFVLGVAWWILPRHTLAPARGREALGWAGFWLLNAGTLSSVCAQTVGVSALAVSGNVLMALGAAFLVVPLWGRVKAFGQ